MSLTCEVYQRNVGYTLEIRVDERIASILAGLTIEDVARTINAYKKEIKIETKFMDFDKAKRPKEYKDLMKIVLDHEVNYEEVK